MTLEQLEKESEYRKDLELLILLRKQLTEIIQGYHTDAYILGVCFDRLNTCLLNASLGGDPYIVALDYFNPWARLRTKLLKAIKDWSSANE